MMVDRRRYQEHERKLANEIKTDAQYAYFHSLGGQPRSLRDSMNSQIARESEASEQILLDQERNRQESENARIEQIRRRVCAESDEIRQLQARLGNALLNRERAAQIQEALFRRRLSESQEAEIDKQLLTQLLQDRENDSLKERQLLSARAKAKEVQLQQMAEREASKRSCLVEFEKEKEQVDAALEKLRLVDSAEREARMTKASEVRNHLRQFMAEREQMRAKEIEKELLEEKRIADFRQQVLQREQQMENERLERERARSRVFNAITGKMADERKKEDESLQMRNELYQEERELRDRTNEHIKAQRRMEEKLELLAQYEHQLAEKQHIRQTTKFEEAMVRQALLEDFEKNEKLELLSNQKRREKVLVFNKELAKLVEEKRRMFEDERQKEMDHINKQKQMHALHCEIIKEERTRIMNEFDRTVGNSN